MAPPVITITRQYASGGAAVARQVAAALAWTVIDNEFVDEVARRAGLAPATVAEHEERAPGLLERLARTLAVASPEMFITSDAVPRAEQDETTIVKLTERSEEHTSELQSQSNLVCRLLLEKKKQSLFQLHRLQHLLGPRDHMRAASSHSADHVL